MATVLDVVLEAIDEVFSELYSLAQAATLHVASAPTYDTATDQETQAVVNVALRGFVEAFKHHEIDGLAVRVGDKKFLVNRATAEAAAVAAGTIFAPKVNDRVTLAGVIHSIEAWGHDPARATVELRLRRAV